MYKTQQSFYAKDYHTTRRQTVESAKPWKIDKNFNEWICTKIVFSRTHVQTSLIFLSIFHSFGKTSIELKPSLNIFIYFPQFCRRVDRTNVVS